MYRSRGPTLPRPATAFLNATARRSKSIAPPEERSATSARFQAAVTTGLGEHLRLYDYLDEQLDARNVLYSVLLKYQHRSEWFGRHYLREIAAKGLEGKPAGERSLAVDLQRYVFDQGVDFTIEEAAASGEPDLILRDSDDRHVVIDAKYVRSDYTPSKIRRTIADGFHQVARYCQSYQEPAGFLVVFYDHQSFPRLPLETKDGLSFLTVKSIAVYFILVNLFAAPSASKGGISDELVIDRAELLKETSDLPETSQTKIAGDGG